jgi:transcriptional regulator with XRE-family HTH domain
MSSAVTTNRFRVVTDPGNEAVYLCSVERNKTKKIVFMESKMIGSKIAEARKKINISQAQLAERLFISPQAVGKWERGESMPDITTFNRLAEMLGVQRPTVTNASRDLERAGLIERGRRQVTVLDRQGLTKASCECYQLVRTRVAFHLPKTYT